MGQALYRKYRSKSLDELVGQDHVRTVLQHALKQDNISHAYLLSGPRGVGKTTVARILAHEVNNLPYNDSSEYLDIIEIDAASHRRIDEIRELRERAYVAPVSAQYKVYIIDEVHMLTKESFNALLKLLEEPPAHVIFILATTEAHKLPQTIISRTQQLTFRPIEPSKVASHLKTIAKHEKIPIDDDALDLIARHGEGSFRDSISLLDQVRNQSGKINANDVLAVIGQVPAGLIDDLYDAVTIQSVSQAVLALQILFDQGYEAATIARQLGETCRSDALRENPILTHDKVLQLLGDLLDVPSATNPEARLELAILHAGMSTKRSNLMPQVEQPQDGTSETSPPQANNIPKVSPPKSSPQFDESVWPSVLDDIKHTHNTLYSTLRMARPTWDNDQLSLGFHFAFHKKRVDEPTNRQIVAQAVENITGERINVVTVVDKSISAKSVGETDEKAQLTDTAIVEISTIFGGAEVLESEGA